MSVEWYDMIAKRNGGYKSDAVFTIEGLSGEAVFEDRLKSMLLHFETVLDAGCGDGEFTVKMARYATRIIGFDNSVELLKIADALKSQHQAENVQFVYGTTRSELPFEDGHFDFVYTRRGPTSILNHSRILRSGGTIFGIHSAEKNKVLERLEQNGFVDVEIEEFNDAMIVFPDAGEFAKYLSASHGNPDYTSEAHRKELDRLVSEHSQDGRLTLKEWRYIWKAKKP
jgi:SAM-dependent methyltransferase